MQQNYKRWNYELTVISGLFEMVNATENFHIHRKMSIGSLLQFCFFNITIICLSCSEYKDISDTHDTHDRVEW